MKKLILSTVLLATLTAVNAQDKGQTTKATQNPATMEQRASERAAKEADPMVAQLGLNAEQAEKFTAINQQHTKAIKDLENSGLTGEALTARSMVLNSTYENGVKGLLTAEQFEKWGALRLGAEERSKAAPAK